MTRLWFVLFLCVLPWLAHGQTVTFDFGQGTPQTYTYSAEEMQAMTRLLAEVNRQRTTSTTRPVPPWTLEDWQLFVVKNTVSSYLTEVQSFHAQDGCEHFKTVLTDQGRAEALAFFGGRNPCAPTRP